MSTIAIGVPSARDISVHTLKASETLIFPPGVHRMNVYNTGAILYAVRGGIVEETLKNQDVTHLLFLDSDMVPPQDGLLRLYERDVDIVFGLCPRRTPPYKIVQAPEEDEHLQLVERVGQVPRFGLHEVAGGGLAFALIKRHVLETVLEKEGPHIFFHERTEFGDILGEDLSFCRKARRCGFRVYMDADCHVGHLTDFPIYPIDYFREWWRYSSEMQSEVEAKKKRIRELEKELEELKAVYTT